MCKYVPYFLYKNRLLVHVYLGDERCADICSFLHETPTYLKLFHIVSLQWDTNVMSLSSVLRNAHFTFLHCAVLQWKKPWSCRTVRCSSTRDRRVALEHERSSRREFTMSSWREAPRERRTEKSEIRLTKPASKDHRSFALTL